MFSILSYFPIFFCLLTSLSKMKLYDHIFSFQEHAYTCPRTLCSNRMVSFLVKDDLMCLKLGKCPKKCKHVFTDHIPIPWTVLA